jgi:hypothetical protein
VGGGAGAAIGQQVGGKNAAIVGAGVGGAAGSAIGRDLNSKPQTTSVTQETTVALEVQCKPKHKKGKGHGWAKGHDKHC